MGSSFTYTRAELNFEIYWSQFLGHVNLFPLLTLLIIFSWPKIIFQGFSSGENITGLYGINKERGKLGVYIT